MHQTFHPNYIDFFSFFNGNKDYFECHEVLEELWKEVAPGDKDHSLVGFIQIATGLYHWRRGNFRGAEKSLTKGLSILTKKDECKYLLPIQYEIFIKDIQNALQNCKAERTFKPFMIAFQSKKLEQLVQSHIKQIPKQDSDFILNKHMLRDRTEIIQTRKDQLQIRQKYRAKI